MSKSLLASARIWHRKIASVLFVFFFVIAVTGTLLGWKSLLTTTIYENKNVKPSNAMQKWLPLDSLEVLAVKALKQYASTTAKQADNIALKPAKGYINFSFKGNYNVQIDGETGCVKLIEQKNGSLIQDIHDGAILDTLMVNKLGISKKVYSTIMGISLLLLTLSGFYLWFKPKLLKKR